MTNIKQGKGAQPGSGIPNLPTVVYGLGSQALGLMGHEGG